MPRAASAAQSAPAAMPVAGSSATPMAGLLPRADATASGDSVSRLYAYMPLTP